MNVWHPLFVHFPIAFYFMELILLGMWMVKQDLEYRRFALFSFKLGYMFMIAAIITGLIDAGGFKNIVGDGRNHFLAAMTVFAVYTIRAFYWRFASGEYKYSPSMNVMQALAGNTLVAFTSYFGYVLVYGR